MKKSKSHNRTGSKHFLLFTLISLLVIGVIVGLIYWQRTNITTWMSDTAVGITRTFGWGLVLLVLAILTLLAIIFSKPIILWRYWNKWIGGLILFAALWGILAMFPGTGYLESYSLGGIIGQRIIGSSNIIGIFVILLLIIVGVIFITPRGFAGLTVSGFSWLVRRLKKSPAESTSSPVALPLPSRDPMPPVRGLKTEEEVKPTAFPRYSPPPTPRPSLPENGSKRWLWARLHPGEAAETETPVDTTLPVINGPGITTMATKTSQKPGSESVSSIEAGKTEAPTVKKQVVGSDNEEFENDQSEDAEVGIVTEDSEEKSETTSTTALPAGSPQALKQVAAEVWKKYGESDSVDVVDGWKLPPAEILDVIPEVEFSQADNLKKAKLIEDALASYGVEGKVVQINVGPTVTQFGIEPGWDRKLKEVKEKNKNGDVQVRIEEVAKTRVKVDRITTLANDLSLALAAPSIRIEAPVPGKSVVGVEVPNNTIGIVSLRGVVESNTFQKMQAKSKLAVGLGKGAGGESVVGDLTKMPHLLIAGATGSGKTVCIHAIICCFLLYNTPGDVRFIMIDPKRVELTSYNSLPHLATPVIVDTNKALGALRWLTQEMDKRYQTMAAARQRNIDAYNKARPNEKLPYLVLVIDELADLMMTAGQEVEQHLCRLAQLARAVGIHLIVATQRPSVDVITGLIKSNFPTRISFAVTSQVDSRTILDSGGAEKLLGRGDMLYMPTEASKPKRLQGCFVSDPEIERLVYFWNNQKKEVASQLKMDELVAAEVAKAEKPPEDPLMEQARKLAQDHINISASFLQRHLRIGYPRAARIMEQLEDEMGINEMEDEELDEIEKEDDK